MTAWRLSILVVLASSGCVAATSRDIALLPPQAPAVPATVFVADGAGNYQLLSKALRNVVKKDGRPIDVVTHEWSHGKYRILADYLHNDHARIEGKRLADKMIEHRAAYPERPIHLIGHSAGATVVVAALENLPDDFVERAVLLAPAISAEYDVQPALRSVQSSLHVFCSPYDYVILGFATRVLGTPDHRWTAMAGRQGFREDPVDPKLVQRPWQPADCVQGNNGGHFGGYQPEFLRANVLPLFLPARDIPPQVGRARLLPSLVLR